MAPANWNIRPLAVTAIFAPGARATKLTSLATCPRLGSKKISRNGESAATETIGTRKRKLDRMSLNIMSMDYGVTVTIIIAEVGAPLLSRMVRTAVPGALADKITSR